jgi:Cu+-exporting ATPase
MQHSFRPYLKTLLQKLSLHFKRSLLSGDQETEQDRLREIMGKDALMHFRQDPANKLEYIYQLQEAGDRVMMIGDGLNDAGALKQSDVGIAIAEDSNHFTPASDAILEASGLSKLHDYIWLCHMGQRTIRAAFALSILYNIIGLGLAVQGYLLPMYAAILMPASSISILLITYGATNWLARRRGL